MKKIILSLVLALLCVAAVQAEEVTMQGTFKGKEGGNCRIEGDGLTVALGGYTPENVKGCDLTELDISIGDQVEITFDALKDPKILPSGVKKYLQFEIISLKKL